MLPDIGPNRQMEVISLKFSVETRPESESFEPWSTS